MFLVCLCSLQVSGQVYSGDDTIAIREVVIRADHPSNRTPGFRTSHADTALLREHALKSLADLLSNDSPVFIKSYGSGGAATPSLRGTGAGNTSVTWNGFRLDNPMLGQPDLSLLPAGLTESVSIDYGGAALSSGSGSAGGSISLETDAAWTQPRSASFSAGMASFGKYSGLLSLRAGNGNFRTVTKGFFQSAENDFPFTNHVYGPEPFTEKRKNSQMVQYGLLQEAYFRTSKNLFSARFWYQNVSRNLPSSLLLLQSANTEKQLDESFRLMAGYEHKSGNGNVFLTGAVFTDRLDYNNRLASIESENLSSTFSAKGGIRDIKLPWNLEADFIVNEELNSVRSNNYESNPTRNTADLTASLRSSSAGKITGAILVREILFMNRFLLPDFSAGVEYKPFGYGYALKGSIARSSGIPTLNDLYWSPGGNPSLKNEYAFMMELGYAVSGNPAANLELSHDVALFRNSIKDMIQWRPGEFSWWSAQNIGHVNTYGAEIDVSLRYKSARFSSGLDLSYSYTKAFDDGNSEKKQLIYVPAHQFNGNLRVRYGNVTARWRTSGNGVRFTVPDNSKYLPGYAVSSIMIGTVMNRSQGTLELDFEVDNLFNKEYQTIAYYPLPGRTFSLRIMLMIK